MRRAGPGLELLRIRSAVCVSTQWPLQIPNDSSVVTVTLLWFTAKGNILFQAC